MHNPWPPREIVLRRSTDFLAVPDKEVVTALCHIRRYATLGIGVDDVLAIVPLSRSSLDSRFKQHVGRTVSEELTRVRLEHAKHLLTTTDMPIEAIAADCGLHHTDRIYRLFRRHFGCTPGQYRLKHR